MSQSSSVECPICGRCFPVASVNGHVDQCLAASERGQENKQEQNNCSTEGSSSPSALIFGRVTGPKTSSVSSENSSPNAMKRNSSNLAGKSNTNPPLKKMKSDAVLTNCATSPEDKGKQKSAFFSPGRKEPVNRQNPSSSFMGRKGNNINSQSKSKDSGFKPLAERMRPKSLSEYVGQSKVLGSNSLLRTLLESQEIPSMILWGPPGCGKTSLAHIIANNAKTSNKARFVQLSATTSGINDVKEVVKVAKNEQHMFKRKTILFVDEIHRFNKMQQDTFLPHVENGTITLIGATTENPSFQLNNALLSRCRVMVLEKLTVDHIEQILKNALNNMGVLVGKGDSLENKRRDFTSEDSEFLVSVEEDAVTALANLCDGDARIALNGLQLAIQSQVAAAKQERDRDNTTSSRKSSTNLHDNQSSSKHNGEVSDDSENQNGCNNQKTVHINVSHVKEGLQRTHLLYDRNGEEHYNIISALHKSIRGSDESAALYWLARMLVGGEDPLYVARRLVRFASEDIGLADPQALKQAVAAYQACHFIGMPECDVILAQATVYLSRAPKSVEVYNAYSEAKKFVNEWDGPQPSVPLHIRNAPTKLMKGLGYGAGYKYNPSFDEPVEQSYLPPEVQGVDFFAHSKKKANGK